MRIHPEYFAQSSGIVCSTDVMYCRGCDKLIVNAVAVLSLNLCYAFGLSQGIKMNALMIEF